MKLKYVMDIKCTPEKIWYWLGTPERAIVWQTNVSNTEIVVKTSNWIGTIFRETIEENGSTVEMQGVVTDYKENQSLAMHLSSKYNTVTIEWCIKEMGEYTNLIITSNIQFKSFMRVFNVFLWPVFKRKLQGQFDKEYAKLKVLCEQNN